MEKLIVSTSPHVHTRMTTGGIMRDVLIALSPAAIASVILFGLKSLYIIIACTVSAVVAEYLFNLITRKTQTVSDCSAAVTGVILALSLPASTKIWHCVLGAVIAIVVVKCLFGGIGCNFANPAVTARIFLIFSFAEIGGGTLTRFMDEADLVTGATPLEIMQSGRPLRLIPDFMDMFLGNRSGAIGETCALAILIGFAYLVVRRIIRWEVPVIFVATVFVMTLAIKGDLTFATYQILSGGLLFGAVFMATDYVTTPLTVKGKMLFALGCGIITTVIRLYGDYPEGVSFAILLMNIVSPYLEKLTAPRPLGGKKNER